MARLPTRSLLALGAELAPGLHLVAGDHGSGKTQLLVQTAVEAAASNVSTQLFLPDTAKPEAARRVAAVLSGQPWSALEETDATEHLDRLSGAPFALEAAQADLRVDGLELAPGSLTVLDLFAPPPIPEVLRRLRHTALETGVVLLASWPSRRGPSGKGPVAAAISAGLDEAALSIADSVWVIEPGSPPQSTVVCAKARWGASGKANLQFRGARFEDEPEDLDLSLE